MCVFIFYFKCDDNSHLNEENSPRNLRIWGLIKLNTS